MTTELDQIKRFAWTMMRNIPFNDMIQHNCQMIVDLVDQLQFTDKYERKEIETE